MGLRPVLGADHPKGICLRRYCEPGLAAVVMLSCQCLGGVNQNQRSGVCGEAASFGDIYLLLRAFIKTLVGRLLI